jgi:hypothetical protein
MVIDFIGDKINVNENIVVLDPMRFTGTLNNSIQMHLLRMTMLEPLLCRCALCAYVCTYVFL